MNRLSELKQDRGKFFGFDRAAEIAGTAWIDENKNWIAKGRQGLRLEVWWGL